MTRPVDELRCTNAELYWLCCALARFSRGKTCCQTGILGADPEGLGLGEQWEAGDLLREGVIKNEF